jgi:small subunit ribosomal protein S6
MLKTYELVLVVSGKASEEEQKKILEEVKKTLSSKGKVIKTDLLGKKALAYSMKKEREGYYIIMNVEIEGAVVSQLSQQLRLNKLVLRHLIVNK